MSEGEAMGKSGDMGKICPCEAVGYVAQVHEGAEDERAEEGRYISSQTNRR